MGSRCGKQGKVLSSSLPTSHLPPPHPCRAHQCLQLANRGSLCCFVKQVQKPDTKRADVKHVSGLSLGASGSWDKRSLDGRPSGHPADCQCVLDLFLRVCVPACVCLPTYVCVYLCVCVCVSACICLCIVIICWKILQTRSSRCTCQGDT